ncbi:site-specific integrase [Kitasatospora sp. NBC_01246]|uniref:tyrosine-type recombinase/integrase n=1 Tax=Kitasatospora sp. NBC_01246 TaxID=2903570 RepID=UPI002E3254B5|nr:hypothetical protein [Kitasatospora sp. NBC_01246]
MASADGRRRQQCRSGYPTRKAACQALEHALDYERTGLNLDDDLTVAGYLTEWLRTKQDVLKPTTYARYRDHVHNDLIPAFGRLKPSDPRERHLTGWNGAELARGRGRTSVYRAGATLSSALNTAVRTRRPADNPACFAVMPRPFAPERICWTPSQAAAFLRHNHDAYGDQLADAFEVLLGTGLRRGELLGLHWPEVHLAEQMLLVRWSPTAVPAGLPVRPRRAARVSNPGN